MPDSFDGFRSLWSGADPKEWDKEYASTSPAVFNYVFDVYNFSIISNLFDDNKP